MKQENEKSFCITFENGLQSFAYNIENLDNGEKSITRLETQDEVIDNNTYKRIFYLANQNIAKNDLLLVNIESKKVSINRYTLSEKCLKVQKNVADILYEVVVPESDSVIEFDYSQNLKRNVCVFDVENQQEVVPLCSYNKYNKELKGKYRLNKNNQYVVLNIK